MTSIDIDSIPDDPFSEIKDEDALDPLDTVTRLLASTKRGYVPLRNEFVQKRDGEDRSATLARLVTGKHERALDALLLLHALQPVLTDTPLPMSTWARMLSTKEPCTPNGASKAFATLEGLDLVRRETATQGRATILHLLDETGSGAPWSRPGQEATDRYFAIPHEYWTNGVTDRLRLAGKAMFLIIAKETQDPKRLTFSMPVSKAHDWYGISERTAERGYSQLGKAKVVQVRVQKIADARHPAGRREIYHRALDGAFSTKNRAALQKKAAAAVGRGAASASGTATVKKGGEDVES